MSPRWIPRLEVGAAETRIEVNAESSDMLIKDSPLRGGNFQPREVRDLPLVSLNPLSLARTLPGATDAAGSRVWTGGEHGGGFSINGQRPRGNNYMLDGTENNRRLVNGRRTGIHYRGCRGGGFRSNRQLRRGVRARRRGVFNVVTKSGTNDLHGTLLWRYQSQRFDSVSNLDRLNGIPSRSSATIFTDSPRAARCGRTGLSSLPASSKVTDIPRPITHCRFPRRMQSRGFARCSRAIRDSICIWARLAISAARERPLTSSWVSTRGLALIAARYNSRPARMCCRRPTMARSGWLASIAINRKHTACRGAIPATRRSLFRPWLRFPALFSRIRPAIKTSFSPTATLSRPATPMSFASRTRGRIEEFVPWPGSVPLALTLPRINFPSAISSFGLVSENTQFQYGNNFLFQETQTKLSGRHAFRYGLEFLRQTVTEARGANDLGTTSLTDATALGYSAFANFLDDFSGPSASTNRAFGASVFHPTQLRQTYFFQDNWKLTPSLALTMGLRYENFGQPANVLPYPAFSGFDPAQFLVRHEISPDNKDFGPAFGLAWSPGARSGWLGKLFGDGKTVWRGGYQISYDAPFAQAIFLHAAQSSPNAITVSANSLTAGRGSPDWYRAIALFGSRSDTLGHAVDIR